LKVHDLERFWIVMALNLQLELVDSRRVSVSEAGGQTWSPSRE
jgi:hypothetical protein